MAKSIGVDEQNVDVLKILKKQMTSQKHNLKLGDNIENHVYNEYQDSDSILKLYENKRWFVANEEIWEYDPVWA